MINIFLYCSLDDVQRLIFSGLILTNLSFSRFLLSGLRKKTVRGAPPQADESNVVSRVNNELFGTFNAYVHERFCVILKWWYSSLCFLFLLLFFCVSNAQFFSQSASPSLYFSLQPTNTHTHTHTHTFSHSHSLHLALSLSLSHTRREWCYCEVRTWGARTRCQLGVLPPHTTSSDIRGWWQTN